MSLGRIVLIVLALIVGEVTEHPISKLLALTGLYLPDEAKAAQCWAVGEFYTLDDNERRLWRDAGAAKVSNRGMLSWAGSEAHPEGNASDFKLLKKWHDSEYCQNLVGSYKAKIPSSPQTQDTPHATINQVSNFTEPSEISNALNTRFGDISISGENILLFNGQPLSPSIQGNNSLSLVDYSKGEKSDTLLVRDNGGAACPALYHFISISVSGAKSSEEFGTCSDSLKTARSGGDIIVSMPGFSGSFESAEAQQNATKELHVFSLSDGKVLNNGKPESR